MSGPLISGVKNIATKSATNTTGHGGRNGSTQIGTRTRASRAPASRSGATLRTATTASEAPDERARAERGVEEPGDAGAPVELVEGVDGEPGRHPRAEEAERDDDRGDRAEQLVAERGSGHRRAPPCCDRRHDRLAPRDERQDEQERDEVGRGVHVEDVRRADDRDEQAGERRADQRGERGSALDRGCSPATSCARPRRRAPAGSSAATRSTAA